MDMQTKQTISIIGNTLNIGSFLATRLSSGNFRLLLCTGKPQTAETLVEEIHRVSPKADAEVSDCPFDASWESDIILIAAPVEEHEEIAGRIRPVSNQKVVINITTISKKGSNGMRSTTDTNAAETMQRLLPNSKLVATSISGFESEATSTDNAGKQIDALIYGDDRAALETVADMFRAANIHPIIMEVFPQV